MPNEKKLFSGSSIIFNGCVIMIAVIVSWFAGYEFCKEKFKNGDYKVKIENVSVIVGK